MTKPVLLGLAVCWLWAGCSTSASLSRPSEAPSAKGKPKAFKLPPYQVLTLENGLELALVEKRDVPLVTFSLRISGGSLGDEIGKEGTASLLAELMTKGAGPRSAAAFAETVDAAGAYFTVGSDLESFELSGQFLSRDFDLMLELLHDVLRKPALDVDEFRKIRDRRIQALAASKDGNLRRLLSQYAQAQFFGSHPYGRPVDGSESSLARVEHDDVTGYFSDRLGADGSTLVIVGDIRATEAESAVRARFSDWHTVKRAVPAPVAPTPRPGGTVLLVDKPDATQTYFAIGSVAPGRKYDQRAALDVVNTLFGGRFTSMLNTKLRVESGLTYGASSRLERRNAGGSVAMESFTKSETTREAIDLALSTLTSLRGDGLSEDALESSRTYILGQTPPRYETAAALARTISLIECFDLGRDYIDGYGGSVAQVSSEEASAVIKQVYPGRKSLRFVMIGNAEKIRKMAAEYGTVTEMSIQDPKFAP